MITLPPGFTHSIHAGFLGGAEYEYWFSAYKYWSGTSWGLDAQVLYDQKGEHYDFTDINAFHESGNGNDILNYLEIPILVKARFGSADFAPYVFAGPSIGIFLSGADYEQVNGSLETKTSFADSELTSPDISALFGAGVSIALSSGPMLFFEASYALGLVNIDKMLPIANFPVIKSRDIRIAIGILFPLDSPGLARSSF
ncbi:MAG TPA: porin family protein [Candidatus Kapabacteria bacterium]|nr:porin family protein [Candidatus Kapabacteria bacterium]